ncbi:hypothetical protein GLOTRDRAFT_114547 [Gloeophyllum trabeum ATCC 11539]|uniref:Small ribosomal subunit protein mS38 n=1 Tax=Gloeophyllum trabeum (strain ATCC 11539 / FP-39264 / Madison 617) TaxID=670483 RepID=S7QFR9_GLOTA|nr:uncharacterized protein GLOTRDRAFT_114547 [Gloeophyllum trabeum ATCC 11539]EPQ57998.1 hypothetical protein GLOTRDRAFT_114547 [Gloeophyllum trabeum ATCC 11539]
MSGFTSHILATTSMLSRLLKPTPASRRAYSFFSSKPGGGRYFNSAKPPKVVASTNGTNNGKTKVDAAGGVGASGTAGESSKEADVPAAETIPAINHTPLPVHPPVNPHDVKLHQFFSLHRPLLLLSQPAQAAFESSPSLQLSSPASEPEQAGSDSSAEPPEASPEADADAARQLSRALVMNRVGGTISWQGALKRLGLDLPEGEGRADEMNLSGYNIQADSTKRKRRKKMKKHKLKKRRRLQRATRIKIGK